MSGASGESLRWRCYKRPFKGLKEKLAQCDPFCILLAALLTTLLAVMFLVPAQTLADSVLGPIFGNIQAQLCVSGHHLLCPPSAVPGTPGEEGVEQAAPPSDPASAACLESDPLMSPRSYITRQDDTMEGIARLVYGESRYWPFICEENRDLIEYHYCHDLTPSQRRNAFEYPCKYIAAGWELIIPPLPGRELRRHLNRLFQWIGEWHPSCD